MITAEEFLKKFLGDTYKGNAPIEHYMIEFAKLHVKEALKEALESIPCLGSSSDIASYEAVRDAVLNSYPLEEIK